MKHIVCYSGGHSSALTAIEVVREFGSENVILLNHDIARHVEDPDIKRFKREVSDYIQVPITYANHQDMDTLQVDQFDVCVKAGAFKGKNSPELCTSRLKTGPFMRWLKENIKNKDECIIYYGFDKDETHRIQRKIGILAVQGYHSDYPLALWKNRTISSTHKIGIKPPLTYGIFKHANCTGCLKAGKQHWYLVFYHRPDIWLKAKETEEVIGYSILNTSKGAVFLDELEDTFQQLKDLGIKTTEAEDGRSFSARCRKALRNKAQLELLDGIQEQVMNCDCAQNIQKEKNK